MKTIYCACLLFLLIFFYFVSHVFLSYYVGGDQAVYTDFYNRIGSEGFLKALSLQHQYTGSREPLYALFSWVGAKLSINKVVYFSFYNSMLLISLIILSRKYGAGLLFIFLLLTNFYVLVLLTGAERLKFAYLCLILGLIFSGKLRLLLFSFAPFFHFQSFIFYLSGVIWEYTPKKIRAKIKKPSALKIFRVFCVIAAVSLFVVYFRSGIVGKVVYYFSGGLRYSEVLNFFLLFLVGLIVLCQRIRYSLAFFPIFIGILLLGSDRLNMVAVTAFLWFVLKERKSGHVLVISVMMYFTYKSLGFVINVYKYGDGFYSLA